MFPLNKIGPPKIKFWKKEDEVFYKIRELNDDIRKIIIQNRPQKTNDKIVAEILRRHRIHINPNNSQKSADNGEKINSKFCSWTTAGKKNTVRFRRSDVTKNEITVLLYDDN